MVSSTATAGCCRKDHSAESSPLIAPSRVSACRTTLFREILPDHFEYVAGLTVQDRSNGVHGHTVSSLRSNERWHHELHRGYFDIQQRRTAHRQPHLDRGFEFGG